MGRDFTGYGEIRIKRVPEELKALIRAEAKRLGMDERGVMLMKLWGPISTPDRGSYKPPVGTNRSPNETPDEKFSLPEWVPRVPWGHFEEWRRKMRKPLTEAAKRTAVARLEKLRGEGQDPGKVLEEAVYRGWQGLFAVEEGGGGNGHGGRKTVTEHNREAFREAARLRGDPTPEDEH